MFVLAVTGTPGTGKTTLAQEVALSQNAYYLDVLSMIEEHDLSHRYDEELQTHLVSVPHVVNEIQKKIHEIRHSKEYEGIVIDSHLSHYLPAHDVTLCVVTTCSLKELKKRLLARNYSQQKIRDNLEAEAFDTCLLEAHQHGHTITVVETG